MKVSALICALLAGLIASSLALTHGSSVAGSSPTQVALDWNSNAVSAVRAARTTDGLPPGSPALALYQTEGPLYLSHVRAAVYDATMKISQR